MLPSEYSNVALFSKPFNSFWDATAAVAEKKVEYVMHFQFLLGCYWSSPWEPTSSSLGFQFLLGCYARTSRIMPKTGAKLSIPFGMLPPISGGAGLTLSATFNSFWDATQRRGRVERDL